MNFNGDANNQDLVSDMDFVCSTNNNTYPIADKVRNFAFGLAKVSSRIMKKDRTWKHVSSNSTTIPIAVKDLVAGQDNYGLETKHLKILRVRIKGSDGVMKTLLPLDRNKTNDDILNASGEPTHYDKIGFSLMPYPAPNYGATAGLEIEYQPGAAIDLPTVSSTDWVVGFNQDFERLPGLYASKIYCGVYNRERLSAINDEIIQIEADIDDYFQDRDIDDEPSFDVVKTSRGPSLM